MKSNPDLGDYDGDNNNSSDGMSGGSSRGYEGSGRVEPIFLRKVYSILETCPPEIACWSDKGDSFIIKDPDAFAAQIIPQYFAHSNFSSFVRQLNFYQFRKCKADVKAQAPLVKQWEFKHEKFIRGQQHLLSQIRRATHGSTASEQEVTNLKSELGQMKERLQEMTDSISKLTSLVNDLMIDKINRDQQMHRQQKAAIASHDPLKKRKSCTGPVLSQTSGIRLPEIKCEDLGVDGYNFGGSVTGAGLDYLSPDTLRSTDPLPPLSEILQAPDAAEPLLFQPLAGDEDELSLSSLLSFSGLDNGMLASDSPMRPSTPNPPEVAPMLTKQSSSPCKSSGAGGSGSSSMAVDDASGADMDPAVVEAVSKLSPELQRKLVETLMAHMGPASVAAPAATTVVAPQPLVPQAPSVRPPSPSHADRGVGGLAAAGAVALPLASAAVGAFLTEYARSRMDDIPKPQAPQARKAIRTQG